MKKPIIFLLACLLFFMPVLPTFAEEAIHVERLYGNTRYDTAIAISQEAFYESNHAIIASGSSFPDALSASQYAIALDAPVLLVAKDHVPPSVFTELERLGVDNITIAGGPSVVSEGVDSLLSERFSDVRRLSGATRYLTNSSFMEPLQQVLGSQGIQGSLVHWYVSGENFPDALTAAPYTAQLSNVTRIPQFLTLHPSQESLTPGDYAIGGEVVLPGNPSLRLFGENRYATAVEIAESYPVDLGKDIDTVYLASGLNFPDALAAAPLIAHENAVLLLTSPQGLSQETRAFIDEYDITRVVLLGGPQAISDAVLDDLSSDLEMKTKVTRVIDGDTFVATIEGFEERIRLIGVDTPESVHPDDHLNSELGRLASEYTTTLLTGKEVTLEFDVQERDHYGRVLAYAYLGDSMVNKMLLSAGMAQLATYPPNVRYVEEFRLLEQEARENQVGLWGQIDQEPETPPAEGGGQGYGGRGLDYRWEDALGNPLIKGNINSEGVKIYHTPNSPSYSRTKIDTSKGERYFYTEGEALDAGWRAPKR